MKNLIQKYRDWELRRFPRITRWWRGLVWPVRWAIRMVSLGVLLAAIIFACGCSDANRAAFGAWGVKHRIVLYSGGKVVGEWESTGKIENEEHGDGRYFKDDKTGLLVSISGTYSIEVIK